MVVTIENVGAIQICCHKWRFWAAAIVVLANSEYVVSYIDRELLWKNRRILAKVIDSIEIECQRLGLKSPRVLWGAAVLTITPKHTPYNMLFLMPVSRKEISGQCRRYGTDHLPWDGGTPSLQTGKSIRDHMIVAGRRGPVMPQLKVEQGIQAARTIFGKCYFDAGKCGDSTQALRHYRYEVDEKAGSLRKRAPARLGLTRGG
jgi:hypothetical protein